MLCSGWAEPCPAGSDAFNSTYFPINAAGHKDALQHLHRRSQMDFRFLFLKGFGCILYYLREQNTSMCFRALTEVSLHGMSTYIQSKPCLRTVYFCGLTGKPSRSRRSFRPLTALRQDPGSPQVPVHPHSLQSGFLTHPPTLLFLTFLLHGIHSNLFGAGRARKAHKIPLLQSAEIFSNWGNLNIWKSVSIIILETSYGNKRWAESGKISS